MREHKICQALPGSSERKRVGKGISSECYLVDGRVIKRMRFVGENALMYVRALQEEYTKLQRYLSPNIADTDFFLADDDRSIARAFSSQKYIEGLSLQEVTSSILDGKCAPDPLISFYKKCLTMHNKTGLIPDIFGRPHIVGWYTNISNTPNVICVKQGEQFIPILVDVGLAGLSRHSLVGGAHNRLLAKAVERELRKLV